MNWKTASLLELLLATFCVTHACVAIGGLFMLDSKYVGENAEEAVRCGGEDASERHW